MTPVYPFTVYKKLADAGNNELIPIADVEQLAQTGGLKKTVGGVA